MEKRMRDSVKYLLAGGILGLSLLPIDTGGAQPFSERICFWEMREARRVVRDKEQGATMLEALRSLDRRDVDNLVPAVRLLVPIIYDKNLTAYEAEQLAEAACLLTKR